MSNRITKKLENTLLLEDDGVVVGTEVDEENNLFYVIERGGVTHIEPALNKQFKERKNNITHYEETILYKDGKEVKRTFKKHSS